MATILDHRGRPVAPVSPTVEVALSSNAIYGQYQLQPYDPGQFQYHTRDPLISYKGFRTIEKMMEDPQVAASLGLLRYSVLAGGYTISPPKNEAKNPRALEIARFVEYSFKRMRGTVEDASWRILDALPRGFSLAEKTWELYQDGPYKGKLGLKYVKSKKPGAWRFDLDNFDNVLAVESLNPGTDYGTKLPTDKFIHFAWSPEYENPYGQSILRPAYRHWWSKDATIKFWNVFNDKFGAPTVFGKYEEGEAQDVVSQVLNQLRAFQTDQAIAYPRNWEVGLLEVTRAGQSAYEAAVRYHDEQIALSITGQSLATNQHSKGGGSRAQGEVHQDALLVNAGIVKTRLEEVLNEQIIRQAVELNFPDALELVPVISFAPLKPEDIKAIADVLGEMMDHGVVGPGEEWVRERLKFPADERSDEERAIDLDRTKGPAMPPRGKEPGEPPEDQPKPDAPPPPGKRADHSHDAPASAGAFSRQLLPSEQRMDFARIVRSLDELEAGLVDSASSAIQDSRAALVDQVRRQGLFGARGNLAAVKHLELPRLDGIAKAFGAGLARGFQQGLEEGGATVAKMRRRHDHAVEHRPSRSGDSARELAESYLADLPDLIGLEVESSILDDVRAALVQAIRQDWSETEAVAAVTQAFAPWVEEQLADEAATMAPKLQAVVRTNLTDAYNQGLRASYEDPDNQGFVVAMLYSAVLDHRTTKFCRAWDGVVRRIDDPIWRRVTPPNHYNCRSVLVPITSEDRDIEFTKELPTILPQSGF